jgi:hypothetical protein
MTNRKLILCGILLSAGLAAAAYQLGLFPRPQFADLMLAPSSLDFGRLPIGTEAEQLLVATNLGSKPLVVNSIEVGQPFRASSKPFTLEPGASRPILVRFNAQEPWQGSGTLRLAGEGRWDVREVPLVATAHLPAAIEVEPRRLSFGDVEVNGSSRGTITIRNTGGDALRVEGLSAGTPFLPDPAPESIPPGGSQTLEVQFRPNAKGPRDATLSIRSSDPVKGIVTVQLDGSGIDHRPDAMIRVSPAALDFGKVAVGALAEATLTIVNEGKDTLSLTNLVILPPFRAPSRSREIPPGMSLPLRVSFAPEAEGATFAPLVIYSNAPGEGVMTVGLVGEGVLTAGGTASSSAIATNSTSGTASGNVAGPGSGGSADGAGIASAAAAGATSTPAAPPSDAEETAAAPSPVVLKGSLVNVASYQGKLSDVSMGEMSFDAQSGLLTLSDVQLPSIDAALGEYFRFSPTSGVGKVDLQDGEAEITLPVEVLDPSGNKTPLLVKLTTGTSTTVVDGREISFTGKPVGPDGVGTFVATQTVPSGTLRGQSMTFLLNMKVK